MKLTPTIIAVLAMTPVFVGSHPSQEHSATRASGAMFALENIAGELKLAR